MAGANFNYLNIVWSLGNIGNALMAIPNLIGLILLIGVVKKGTDLYLQNKRVGADSI